MSSGPRIDLAALSSCPVPKGDYEHILLGHGSGGRLSAELLSRVFLPAFANEILAALEDQGIVPLGEGATRIAITTDAFVVRPIFFPGGDIGQLAVNGTINDLAVGGAEPVALAAAFILEEGLEMSALKRVVESMRGACDAVGVPLVTGDTKVVDRGKGDSVFITTTGVGVIPPGRQLSIHSARPGDRVLLSGPIGDHGVAIMSVREGLEFETVLESDTAPLAGLTRAMLDRCPRIRCMRDVTRGGLASVLNELASASGVGVRLVESAVPVRREVRAACELLGLDPFYVASEGRLIAAVPPEDADAVLETMQAHPQGEQASIVGEVVGDHTGMVVLRTLVGGERVVTMLAGEQLPRIC